MLEATPTTKFKKDLKKFKHQKKIIKELDDVLNLLTQRKSLQKNIQIILWKEIGMVQENVM